MSYAGLKDGLTGEKLPPHLSQFWSGGDKDKSVGHENSPWS